MFTGHIYCMHVCLKWLSQTGGGSGTAGKKGRQGGGVKRKEGGLQCEKNKCNEAETESGRQTGERERESEGQRRKK